MEQILAKISRRKKSDGRPPIKGLLPERLRADHRKNPVGIDNIKPLLSWTVRSDGQEKLQSAYRIQVSSSSHEIGELWDTGKVTSGLTLGIPYEGKPLASSNKVFWSVKVWDEQDAESDWSETASWSMGLLRPEDWQATWIGFDFDHPQAASDIDSSKQGPVHIPRLRIEGLSREGGLTLPPPRYLRTECSLPDQPIKRATLFLSALGIAHPSIDGCPIADCEFFTPGWTDYGKRIHYRAWDVTQLLTPGSSHCLGVILGDGWFAGYIGYKGDRNHYGSRLRLLAQLEVEGEDGSRHVIGSNASWTASLGPIIEADFLMGETYDARREMEGWDKVGFSGEGWESVSVTEDIRALVHSPCGDEGEVAPILCAQPDEPVVSWARVKPQEITEPSPGVFVFNMGQNFAGVVQLKVPGGEPGQRVVLRFAERLNPDGSIYTTNLRTARATDTYICKGNISPQGNILPEGNISTEVWHPRFTFHGFQYVEVSNYPGKPELDAIEGIALGSDTPRTGWMETSDPQTNQLLSNIYWTQRANFLSVPTDCPQRDERLGWTGDAQIYVASASYFCDCQTFFHKWLADLRDAQPKQGWYPAFAPFLKLLGDSDGGPAWAEAGVICPWTVYNFFGDTKILEESYESMKAFVDFCTNRFGGSLVPPADFRCFGDWLNIEAETPHDLICTAYFGYSASLMAKIAAALGKDSDQEAYSKLFGNIQKAFQDSFVDPDSGRIKGDTQCAYVLALSFDLLQDEQREQAAEYLVEGIQKKNWHLSTGFIGTRDLMLALTEIGRADVAFDLLQKTSFPSWGFSIACGATSIWEHWDGWTPEKGFCDPGMNSFAHYSFGAVAGWMFGSLCGISPASPGFKKIAIRPIPGGDLTWVKTRYKSPSGMIETHWKLEAAYRKPKKPTGEDWLDFILEVAIPANCTAQVELPPGEAVQVFHSGTAQGLVSGTGQGGMSGTDQGNWLLKETLPAHASAPALIKIGSGCYKFVVEHVAISRLHK